MAAGRDNLGGCKGTDSAHRLDNRRPKAILTGAVQPLPGRNASILHTGCATPLVPLVTFSNKSGKKREIGKIEAPSKIADFYDFGTIIGQGGFGTVAQILHAKTFQAYAGKVLQKDSFGGEADRADPEERFRKVMETLLNNDHPNLVRLLHVFEDEEHYYVVMALCEAGTVRRLVRDSLEVLPARVVDDLLEQTICGLAFLHSLRLVHRDVKPENLMLTTAPGADREQVMIGLAGLRVFIVDFDLCSFLLDESHEVVTKHVEGTPGYLAPEVLQKKRYSVASDVFAFGCVLYFTVVREDPCPGLPENCTRHEMHRKMERWLDEVAELVEQNVRPPPLTACCTVAPDIWSRQASPMSPDAPPVERRRSSRHGSKEDRGGLSAAPERLRVLNHSSSLPSLPGVRGQRPRSASTTLMRVDSSAEGLQDGAGPVDREVPIRTWGLLAACLDREPARRPTCQAVLMLFRDPTQRGMDCLSSSSISPSTSPNTVNVGVSAGINNGRAVPGTPSPVTGRKERRRRTSITDLLKLPPSKMALPSPALPPASLPFAGA